jgi:hypothetical protein
MSLFGLGRERRSPNKSETEPGTAPTGGTYREAGDNAREKERGMS